MFQKHNFRRTKRASIYLDKLLWKPKSFGRFPDNPAFSPTLNFWTEREGNPSGAWKMHFWGNKRKLGERKWTKKKPLKVKKWNLGIFLRRTMRVHVTPRCFSVFSVQCLWHVHLLFDCTFECEIFSLGRGGPVGFYQRWACLYLLVVCVWLFLFWVNMCGSVGQRWDSISSLGGN